LEVLELWLVSFLCWTHLIKFRLNNLFGLLVILPVMGLSYEITSLSWVLLCVSLLWSNLILR
jgi:hypothetical protein